MLAMHKCTTVDYVHSLWVCPPIPFFFLCRLSDFSSVELPPSQTKPTLVSLAFVRIGHPHKLEN